MRVRWKWTALVLALSVSLLLMISGLTAAAAESVDLERECSLTLTGEAFEDLANANVVMDVYQVASAQSVSGYDTYSFAPVEGCEGLHLEDVGTGEEDTYTIAVETATAVLKQGMSPAAESVPMGERAEGLKSGLYLVLLHTQGMEDYVQRDAEERVVSTRACSVTYDYTFAPELVALPNKDSGSTSGAGEWVYDMQGAVKAQQQRRLVGVEISKTLEGYNPALGTATCVFDVEAVLDQDGDGVAENVYSDALSLTFNESGTKSLIVPLPVGAQVTVEEVYTGAGYELTAGEKQQSVTIRSGDDTPVVHFTNRANGRLVGGTSVTNHFVYSAEEGHWDWKPLADSTAE